MVLPCRGTTKQVQNKEVEGGVRMPFIRLDKFFSSQEILSRSEIKFLLKAGQVTVNGGLEKNSARKIDTERDKVSLRGENIPYKPYIYLMLNKPRGIICATEDRKSPTVLDLVPPALYRTGLFPAGRLDKDTTGFVLLTNDGDFAHEILSPNKHIEKTYDVELDGVLREEDIEKIRQGIILADGTICRPAKIRIRKTVPQTQAEIVLTEGKYHQVKRMFGVLGLGVTALKRTKMGNLPLDPNLEEGKCREILHKDVEKILGI